MLKNLLKKTITKTKETTKPKRRVKRSILAETRKNKNNRIFRAQWPERVFTFDKILLGERRGCGRQGLCALFHGSRGDVSSDLSYSFILPIVLGRLIKL